MGYTTPKASVTLNSSAEQQGALGFAGEVEKVVKDLGIKMKQSPRELLALADSNKDQVCCPLALTSLETASAGTALLADFMAGLGISL